MKNKQIKTPIFSELLHYVNNRPVPFHVPGHKNGKAMDPELRDFLGANFLSLDLTNIGPLDDLHDPKTIIK